MITTLSLVPFVIAQGYYNIISYISYAVHYIPVLFMTTWMDLEGIRLNEINQKRISTIWFHLYVESKKQNKTNNTKQRQSYWPKKQTDGCHRGRDGGKGKKSEEK